MNKRLIGEDESHIAYSVDFESQRLHTFAERLNAVKKCRVNLNIIGKSYQVTFLNFLHNLRVGNRNAYHQKVLCTDRFNASPYAVLR